MPRDAALSVRNKSGRSTSVRPRTAAAAGLTADYFWKRVVWLVCAAVWAFAVAALLSYSPADPPGHAAAWVAGTGAENWCGPIGAHLAHRAFLFLGSGAWFLAFSGVFFLAVTAAGKPVGQPALRLIGCVMIALAWSGHHALLFPGWSSMAEGGGGLVAILGTHELQSRFGVVGASLWLGLIASVGAMVAYDRWLGFIPMGVASLVRAVLPSASARRVAAGVKWVALAPGRALRSALRAAPAGPSVRENDVDDDKPIIETKPRRRTVVEAKPDLELELGEEESEGDARQANDRRRVEADREEAEVEAIPTARPSRVVEDADDDAGGDDADSEGAESSVDEDDAPREFDPEELRAKMAMLPLRFAGTNKRAATQEDLETIQALNADPDMADYKFPSLDLLQDPEENYNEKMEGFVRDQAAALEEALRVFRIDGHVVGIDSGPVITFYEVSLAPGTKVSQITAVASDIARAMKVVNVRVVPNTEGKDTVGIEAPNLQKERVRLKELMTSSEKAERMKLPLFLGKDASGEPLVYDLAEMPHILIAGTTGSGKSVAMNAIIVGFLYTKKPSDLKLVLVDPKMVEMSQFKDIPHLMCPVITDMNKAAAILEWAVTKMDERYELLAEAGCRDLESYNATPWEELKERIGPATPAEEARIPRKLPRMVFVIDELADMMMTNKEVETSIVRIAQKARAVGIHLILATQRPQANVVTGLIKSNMPSRLCFKVSSGMDSRIVMDQKGGELLLGQGDMLFLSPKSHKLVRAQGTLVEDAEIRKVVRFMREVASPSFERQLVQLRPGDEEGKSWQEHAQEDPLFDKAVDIILETGRGSVSLLQRRLAIGYTRASRLVDLMGLAGIIGEHKGSVAREVMISPEEWEAMKAQAARDAADADARSNDEAAKALASGAPAPSATTGAASASLFAGARSDEPADEDDAEETGAFDESVRELKYVAETEATEAEGADGAEGLDDEDEETDKDESSPRVIVERPPWEDAEARGPSGAGGGA